LTRPTQTFIFNVTEFKRCCITGMTYW